VSAYGSVANGGRKIEPVAILRVTDREGKALFEHKSVEGRRVISEQEAFLVNHILSDNNARLITFGENSLIHIRGRSLAVKTGTTNDQRDNWTVGWTRDTAVGVWVGNNDNHPMKQVASGVSGAAPIWRRIFLEVLKRRPDQAFSAPAGVTAQLVDTVSGWPAHHGFAARSEYFIDGTLPSGEDPIHAMLKVCKASGKLATDVDVAKGDYEEKEYFVFKEADPLSSDGRNRWQEGINAWTATQADSRYHPPTEACSQNEAVLVKVAKPADKEKVESNDVEIQIEVIGDGSPAGEIDWVKIYVDGAEKEKLTGKAPYKKTLFLETGSHAVGARAKFKNDDKEYGANEIRIGVKVPWDYAPPTPAPSPTPTPP
jgi:membrane peptidoglycan carboxypeptidase